MRETKVAETADAASARRAARLNRRQNTVRVMFSTSVLPREACRALPLGRATSLANMTGVAYVCLCGTCHVFSRATLLMCVRVCEKLRERERGERERERVHVCVRVRACVQLRHLTGAGSGMASPSSTPWCDHMHASTHTSHRYIHTIRTCENVWVRAIVSN